MAKVRRLETAPFSRYFRSCNVLCLWSVQAIPTYRVYRLYDSKCRSERLAAESQVKRENSDRARHGTIPLLEQPAVKVLTNVEIPTCSTCCKQFPVEKASL